MPKMHSLLLAVLLLLTAAVASAQPMTLPPGYRVETIDIPEHIMLEVGGLAFTPQGDLLITTRGGQVWRYRPALAPAPGSDAPHNQRWSLFADGLAETLGIHIDPASGGDGDIFVAQRPELTQLIDTNNDGRADLFKTINDDWGFSGNYHEYAFGPVRDSKGNFYVTLNLAHTKIGTVHDSIMGHPVAYRGWALKIAPPAEPPGPPGGNMIPFASGMRSPAGIGINDRDEVFYTDNQGDWNATSSLHHVKQGRFHGHPSSLADDPKFKGVDLQPITEDEYDAMRSLPAVWIPYGELANSPGEPTFDLTGGKFGPFAGQVFVGDQTKSNMMRIALEEVGGEYQGAVFNFAGPLQCGIVRNTFGPDGSLWVGQTQRGWNSLGAKPYGLQRIIYDGETVPFEMHSISLTDDGFDIRFTAPVDPALAADPQSYLVKHWGYIYRGEYGSPKVDETIVKPTVRISEDGKTVHLTLPTLRPRQVYQITLAPSFRAADGSVPTNATGYYTLNRLRD